MALTRVFDPYAMALSFLVGGVGFGMTFFFNTNVQGWGMHEIGYPAMAMVRVDVAKMSHQPAGRDNRSCTSTEYLRLASRPRSWQA